MYYRYDTHIQSTTQTYNKIHVLQTAARQLLGNPTTLKTVKLSFNPLSMSVTKDGNVWLHAIHSTSLYYMDQTNTLHAFTFNEGLHDIAVNPHTDVLYCLLINNIINTVDRRNGFLTKLFVAEGSNWRFAVNTDGNILVGDYANLSQLQSFVSGTMI